MSAQKKEQNAFEAMRVFKDSNDSLEQEVQSLKKKLTDFEIIKLEHTNQKLKISELDQERTKLNLENIKSNSEKALLVRKYNNLHNQNSIPNLHSIQEKSRHKILVAYCIAVFSCVGIVIMLCKFYVH